MSQNQDANVKVVINQVDFYFLLKVLRPSLIIKVLVLLFLTKPSSSSSQLFPNFEQKFFNMLTEISDDFTLQTIYLTIAQCAAHKWKVIPSMPTNPLVVSFYNQFWD